VSVYARLADALAPYGLLARGGFHPEPDEAPAGAATVVLLGNAGPALWRVFPDSPEARDGAPDPLDRWSRRVVETLAADFGARAILPFDGPPYVPFQRWARRAEPVAPSPLGILIHPDYGLWHAYRGALAFPQALDLPPATPRPRPCDTCSDRPCLTTCPVDAFTPDGYDVPACAGHLRRAEGADCVTGGCLARRACPVGADWTYVPEQAGFHMRAFLRARRSD
jgi:hypothetical protein